MPVLKVSLGKVEEHKVKLENPSDKPVKVIGKVTNATNFDFYPDEIIIQPYDY